MDIYLKILNPACKKEGEVHVLRGISMDTVDSPDQLKRIMASQYGDQLPDHEQMEIGYFHKTNKVCIKSRLDVNDVWVLIRKGEKVTLWCIGAPSKGQPESYKRPASEEPGHSAKKVKKGSSAEEKRAAALEFEEKLLAKHPDKYSRYQIRFWAEMLANGGYSDLDNPPAGAAMFHRETASKRSKTENSNDTIMSGVLTVVNTLCQALVPHDQASPTATRVPSATFSPMKKAELRGTYFKQLVELRNLFDQGILTEDEYKEQKEDLVDAVRKLK